MGIAVNSLYGTLIGYNNFYGTWALKGILSLGLAGNPLMNMFATCWDYLYMGLVGVSFFGTCWDSFGKFSFRAFETILFET